MRRGEADFPNIASALLLRVDASYCSAFLLFRYLLLRFLFSLIIILVESLWNVYFSPQSSGSRSHLSRELGPSRVNPALLKIPAHPFSH